MKKPIKIFLMSIFAFSGALLGSGGVAAQPKNTLAEEKICKLRFRTS
jgi:phosphate/sulfate permease